MTRKTDIDTKRISLKGALWRVLDAADYEIESYRMNPGNDEQIKELELAKDRIESMVEAIFRNEHSSQIWLSLMLRGFKTDG